MSEKKILTRENIPVSELQRTVTEVREGIQLSYNEVYYLDYEVNEDTGMIDKNKQTEYYTKEQVTRNLKSMKSAYLVAKGAAAPSEIISFREKYQIVRLTKEEGTIEKIRNVEELEVVNQK